jgi:HAD superfamily hydrolase (TIGR01509 family)
MMISVILVDFNGTLSPGNFGRTFNLYKDKTNGLGKEIMRQYVSAGLLKSLFEGKIDQTSFWVEVSRLTKININILLEIEDQIVTTKTIDQTFLSQIRKLRQEYKVVLATDNSNEWINLWDELFGLSREFDQIFVSATIGFTKQNPHCFHYITNSLNVDFENCLLIDDDTVALEVASSLGIKTLRFQSAENLISEIQIYLKG